jgi:uncharacterized alkaline shock family protein YloU
MSQNNLDLGSVQVHRNAIAEIVYSAVSGLDGVSFPYQSFGNKLYDFLNLKVYPGIKVDIDEGYNISIVVKIVVRFGLNIADVATLVQDTVKAAIEQMVDLNLKDINVNIVGIERGTK